MKVNWLKDADEAQARAKEEKKPLLIEFAFLWLYLMFSKR
jgi:hypothetical protein